MNALVPLGDQAALVYCADETAALRFAAAVRQAHDPWLVDVVQAYTSVAVFFDLGRSRFAEVAERLRQVERAGTETPPALETRRHRIPCCYEFDLDLRRV